MQLFHLFKYEYCLSLPIFTADDELHLGDETHWLSSSGGEPVHAHPQFSQRFIIFHRKDVYHIIDNYQIDHISVMDGFSI